LKLIDNRLRNRAPDFLASNMICAPMDTSPKTCLADIIG